MKLLSKKSNPISSKKNALNKQLFDIKDDDDASYASDGESSLGSNYKRDYYGYEYTANLPNIDDAPSKRSVTRRGNLGKVVTRSAEGLQKMKNSLIGRGGDKYVEMDGENYSDDDSFEVKVTDVEKAPVMRGSRRTKSDDLTRMRNATISSHPYERVDGQPIRPEMQGSDSSYNGQRSRKMTIDSFMSGSQRSADSKPRRGRSVSGKPKRHGSNGSVGSHHSFASRRSTDSKPRSVPGKPRSRRPQAGSKTPTRSQSDSVSRSPTRSPYRGRRRNSLQTAYDMVFYENEEVGNSLRAPTSTRSHDDALRTMQKSLKAKEEAQRGSILSRGLQALENVYDNLAEPNMK
jgi:hypothetical protein